MKWVFIVSVTLYALALFLLAVGTFGWFGQEQDPLSGVFLLPLGLPWNLLVDRVFGISGILVPIITPAINTGILFWLWKR